MIKLYERFNPSIKVCDITSALSLHSLVSIKRLKVYVSGIH